MGPLKKSITDKLTAALKPTVLNIIDDSTSHAEHEAMRNQFGYSETHFKILVVSDVFGDKTPIQRHRLVYGLIDEELKTKGLHAVNIVTKTPKEYENNNNK